MGLYFPDPQVPALPAAAPPSRHAPGKMLRLDAEFIEACSKGDGEWLARHLADGFRAVAVDGSLHGRDSFLALCADPGRSGTGSVEDAGVQFEGDTAIVHCTISSPAASARVTDVWVGREGRWQVLASQRTALAET